MTREPARLLTSTLIKKRRLTGIGSLRLRLDSYSEGSKVEECSIEVTKGFADSWDGSHISDRQSLSQDCILAAWPTILAAKFKPNSTIVLRYNGREFWTVWVLINPETDKPWGMA